MGSRNELEVSDQNSGRTEERQLHFLPRDRVCVIVRGAAEVAWGPLPNPTRVEPVRHFLEQFKVATKVVGSGQTMLSRVMLLASEPIRHVT